MFLIIMVLNYSSQSQLWLQYYGFLSHHNSIMAASITFSRNCLQCKGFLTHHNRDHDHNCNLKPCWQYKGWKIPLHVPLYMQKRRMLVNNETKRKNKLVLGLTQWKEHWHSFSTILHFHWTTLHSLILVLVAS